MARLTDCWQNRFPLKPDFRIHLAEVLLLLLEVESLYVMSMHLAMSHSILMDQPNTSRIKQLSSGSCFLNTGCKSSHKQVKIPSDSLFSSLHYLSNQHDEDSQQPPVEETLCHLLNCKGTSLSLLRTLTRKLSLYDHLLTITQMFPWKKSVV